jgi:hypothetical protein
MPVSPFRAIILFKNYRQCFHSTTKEPECSTWPTGVKLSKSIATCLCQQKQANLFLGSDHFTEMKTIMDNKHTAKRSQTHETIEVAC